MKYYPADKILREYIECYWIVRDVSNTFNNDKWVSAFPGISPDLIIILEGEMTFRYKGAVSTTKSSVLENQIKQRFEINNASLREFIFVQFKNKSLGAIRPFTDKDLSCFHQQDLMNPCDLFGESFHKFSSHLQYLSDTSIVNELDQWFFSQLRKRNHYDITSLFEEGIYGGTLNGAMKRTPYSPSTLERYFKKEIGLTPKHFQRLRRYKTAVAELCSTKNTDWGYYVEKYGYFDQSHFIKEVKGFTSYPPSQILESNPLLSYRN